MKKSICRSFVLGTMLSTVVNNTAFAEQEPNAMLQCRIEAPQTVRSGQPVPLKFTLTNSGKTGVKVLKWNTPLEGWFGDSFKVTKDGQSVRYKGAMVKRFRPSDENYAVVAAGQSLSADVDMAEGYDMASPGLYRVVFGGRLQDIQPLTEGASVSQVRHMQSVACNELTVSVEAK